MAFRIRISKSRQHIGEKKKEQKEKQRSTKHTYQAKGRVTRVTLKIEVNTGALEGSVDPAALVTPVVLI